MKLTCKECGAVISMGDSEGVGDRIAARMQEHMDTQHGTVEAKHRKTLEACRESFAVLMSGGRVSKMLAADLHKQVSDLL
jgi:4-hydroxy-L-threonine phosphate dehydrogenase PdxA